MSLPQGAPGAAEMGTGQTLSVSGVRVAGVERCRDPVSGTSAGGRRLSRQAFPEAAAAQSRGHIFKVPSWRERWEGWARGPGVSGL